MCEIRELPPALAKKAAEELNETSENIACKLEALREWAKAHNHIRFRTNDQFLIAFLRGSKYSLERAKRKLENYYVYRTKMPELFYGRDPYHSKVHIICKLKCLVYLPDPISEDGPRVVMIRPNRFDLMKHTIADVFMVGTMMTDIILLQDDNAIISGYIIIVDLKNVPKDVFLSFNPGFVRKVTLLANKANPSRMKGLHFLNVPRLFTKLYNMVKSVINEKLKDRIYIHEGNLETLHEYVPRNVLTKDYGGTKDDTEWGENWWKRIKEHANYIKEEETYGVVGDLKKIENFINDFNDAEFGVEGSFRKLQID